ncbi:hypothetical protein ACFSJU_14985 [Paradesertivirga mongoliensis]|uniref:Uncharacterized protein n=1 Tax=Paradesertivirga mongoliensis TaxID=2100740 RepID=A0ABW4ZNZ0_9SPHI|nr:hypothetical protein [Pedobacter mongoliensis]
MKIQTDLNIQEIDQRISDIQKKETRLIIFPSPNKIRYANRDGDKLILTNSTFRAFGNINISKKEILVKIEISTVYKIAGIVTLLLFSVSVLFNKVTINGNANPSVYEKLTYLGFCLLLLLIPVLILLKQKSDFQKRIKEVLGSRGD